MVQYIYIMRACWSCLEHNFDRIFLRNTSPGIEPHKVLTLSWFWSSGCNTRYARYCTKNGMVWCREETHPKGKRRYGTDVVGDPGQRREQHKESCSATKYAWSLQFKRTGNTTTQQSSQRINNFDVYDGWEARDCFGEYRWVKCYFLVVTWCKTKGRLIVQPVPWCVIGIYFTYRHSSMF